MKKLIKKIVVFLCATLIAVCSFGCADGAQPDTRTREQMFWDEWCSIQPGVYYTGTKIGDWTADCSGLVETFEIIGTGLDMKIKVNDWITYEKPYIVHTGSPIQTAFHFYENDKNSNIPYWFGLQIENGVKTIIVSRH